MESKNKERISQDQISLFDTYLSVIKEEYQTLNRGQRNFVLHGLDTLVEKLEDGIFSSSGYKTTRKNLAYDRERARKIRDQASLSQMRLAKELGLGRSGAEIISTYERGITKPSNPPRGKTSKAYVKWLKGKGYNPFNL